ncbi:DNA helicase [Klebsiella pneumoniae]|nr:DNA helicase [Klebsiella pneumoniae]
MQLYGVSPAAPPGDDSGYGAASARPEACRDKSKGPRSGDFAGRSPGVQGAAATGRPLCAPGAVSDITQKN